MKCSEQKSILLNNVHDDSIDPLRSCMDLQPGTMPRAPTHPIGSREGAMQVDWNPCLSRSIPSNIGVQRFASFQLGGAHVYSNQAVTDLPFRGEGNSGGTMPTPVPHPTALAVRIPIKNHYPRRNTRVAWLIPVRSKKRQSVKARLRGGRPQWGSYPAPNTCTD